MSAEFIDTLLKRISQRGGRGLRLEAGAPVKMIDASGIMSNVTTRMLTRPEILGAIVPILPEDAKARLPQGSPIEFDYTTNGLGTFRIAIRQDGEQLFVAIDAAGDGAGAPAPGPSNAAAALGTPPPVATMSVPASPPPQPSPVSPPVTTAPVAAPAAEAPPPPPPAVAADVSPSSVTGAGPHPRDGARTDVPRSLVAPPIVATPPPGHDATAAVETPLATAAVTPREHLIDRLFHGMCDLKASDLHLCVGMPPLIRKDGEIRPLEPGAPALDPDTIVGLLDPIMPPKNRDEFARRHDTDFAYEISGLARFRANIFMDRKGRGAVFRVIPSKILTAEDLGLSPHILQLCKLNKGLVLVTGPTGSGKSTTLCAMVDYINRNRTDHIITIEDPIEFVHENKNCLMNQREVHTHTNSFKDALRAALREDPDIVLVGEMRDLETVAIAIETAETGHLVFGTLHTTTAASTVDRVIDQFPTDRQAQIRIMLSESLRGVIAQTLCKKIGGGRVAALEVLMVTPAVSNLIREGKTFQLPSMMQVGKKDGMVPLNDALMELVTKKLVAPDEAYGKAVDKNGFESLLKRAGIDTRFAGAAAPEPALQSKG